MKIAIVVGHNIRRQGAKAYNGQTEFEFNSVVAARVVDLLRAEGVYTVMLMRKAAPIRVQYIELTKTLREKQIDVVVELHFNALDGVKKIGGSEALILDDHGKSAQMAQETLRVLQMNLSIKPRSLPAKIIHDGDRGYFGLDSYRRYGNIKEAMILEPCFADTLHPDSERIIEQPDEYAKYLSGALFDFIDNYGNY